MTMIQLQGRYAWVQHLGRWRLLHVERDEPGDVRTMPRGGWIAFAQSTKSEAQMAYDGVRYPPDRILEELESRGVPHQLDKELALVLVRVSRFQEFMKPLVLDREAISLDIRSQLMLDRRNRLNPTLGELRETKVKKHSDRSEKQAPTLEQKPLPLPIFSVHPGASVDEWGPMMQTGMINESFRSLSFYSHDCEMNEAMQADYQFLSILRREKPIHVTNKRIWPQTNCRILIASRALPSSPSVNRDRWTIPASSNFLIVDNYHYRSVRQITLLILTETQVPFFRSGMAPQTITLAKQGRSHLHQTVSKVSSNEPADLRIASQDFASKAQILKPIGDWKNNPAAVAWLAECEQYSA